MLHCRELHAYALNPASSAGEEWPPKDPEAYVYPDEDPHHKFELPASPWTYENGSVNPDLQPTRTRRRKNAAAPATDYSAVPPYHPDYHNQDGPSTYPVDSEPEEDEDEEGGDVYGRAGRPREFIRRGSEGYEVRPIDREDLLRRYVEERTAAPGRYHLYAPDPPSEPESSAEDDEVPLADKLEHWRASSS